MGEFHLCQEIIQHILQFADGETLLVCKEVSQEFAAAVDYLSNSKKIWEKCYLKEKTGKYPYGVISKWHPHVEGFSHPENWDVIYESCYTRNSLSNKDIAFVSKLQIGKDYSEIKHVQTHGDLILVLMKYNKDFSIFYRILTINLDNMIIHKSARFNAAVVYITPIKDTSLSRRDVISLSCDKCNLIAVPVDADTSIDGYPKFKTEIKFLRVEHSNGDVLWLNFCGQVLNKGNCFHMGDKSKTKEIQMKELNYMKVFQRFTSLCISCGETLREFNTFRQLRASVTASCHYSNLLLLGTDTGMVYAYRLENETDLKLLDLKSFLWNCDICSNSILYIDVMELKDHLLIICSTEKFIFRVHLNRPLKCFKCQH